MVIAQIIVRHKLNFFLEKSQERVFWSLGLRSGSGLSVGVALLIYRIIHVVEWSALTNIEIPTRVCVSGS